MSLHPNQVLLAPVVSEKSYSLISDRKYTFRVHEDAHKTQVRQAVEELFDVKVQKVAIIKVQSKPKRRGFTKGGGRAGRRRSSSFARATRSRSSRGQYQRSSRHLAPVRLQAAPARPQSRPYPA